MRIVLYFLSLITIACFQSTINPHESQEGQNLKLLVDDLSGLARITNAISIQTGYSQKTNRDVIAELLKVNTAAFSKMMEIDSQSIMELSKFVLDRSAPLKLQSIDLASVREPMAIWWNPAKTTQQILDVINVTTKDFVKEIQDATDLINPPCDMSTLKRVHTVVSMKFDKDRPEMLDESYVGDYYILQKSTDSIVNCSATLFNYNTSAFFRPLSTHGSLLTAFHDAVHISEVYLKQRDSFKNFGQHLTTLKDDFTKMAEIWKNASERLKGSDLWAVYGEHLALDAEKIEPTLTVGFRNGPSDLMRLPDDSESWWFREKIVDGADTDKLAMALGPFHEFAKEMNKFESKWSAFHSEFKNSADKFLQITQQLSNIRNFTEGSEKESSIDRMLSAFHNCSPHLLERSLLNTKSFPYFHTAFPPTKKLFHDMMETAGLIDQFKNINLEALRKGVEGLKTVTFEAGNLEKAKVTFDEYVRGVPDLAERLNTLNLIYEKMKMIKEGTAFVKNNVKADDFRINDNIADSHMADYFECFNNSRISVANVTEVIKFVESVNIILKNNDSVRLFQSHLNSLSDTQKAFVDVEKAMARSFGDSGRPNREVPEDFDLHSFGSAKELAHVFGQGVEALSDISAVNSKRRILEEVMLYDDSSMMSLLKQLTRKEGFWWNLKKTFGALVRQLHSLNTFVSEHREKSLLELKDVFYEASKLQGVNIAEGDIDELVGHLQKMSSQQAFATVTGAIEMFEDLKSVDLHLAHTSFRLTSAATSLVTLKNHYRELFGLNKTYRVKQQTLTTYYSFVAAACFGLVLLLVLLAAIAYGFTEGGRAKYYNVYLYYSQNLVVFERRRRYGMFTDRVDGNCIIIDAAQEGNLINAEIAVSKGVNLDAYDWKYGYTALHFASLRGFDKVVELLIKNGANCSLLNAQNKTAEQLIPDDCHEWDNAKNYEICKRIFSKYRNKKYRMRVPSVFPVHNFRIFIHGGIENDEFTTRFRAIITNIPLVSITHYILPTDADGVLVTDDVDIIFLIFTGMILMKESWMEACLKDEKLIAHDEKYLIEKVQFKGVVYNSLIEWTTSQSKATMPYLVGIQFYVCMQTNYLRMEMFQKMVMMYGARVVNELPQKEDYNVGSHPYLHVNRGPLFIIHDDMTRSNAQLEICRNDPDQMYTLMTEEEFLIFLLKREVFQDTNPSPLLVKNA